MKIALNKKAITIDEVQEAKQLQKDYGEALSSDLVEGFANRVTGARFGNLVAIEKLEVTKNRYQLTVWATVVIATHDTFYRTSFDVLQADRQQDNIDNYTQIFKLATA